MPDALVIQWFEREHFRWGSHLVHHFGQSGDHLGVLGSNVILFADILSNVVKFDLKISLGHFLPNRFPITHSDRLLTSVTGKLAIEVIPLWLLLSFENLLSPKLIAPMQSFRMIDEPMAYRRCVRSSAIEGSTYAKANTTSKLGPCNKS